MSWGATRYHFNRAALAAPTVDYAVAADGRNNMYGGLVRDGSRLFCPYRQDPVLWGGWRGRAFGRTSDDDGQTWSEAELIWNPEGGYGMQEIKVMILDDGTYLLSGSKEHSNPAGTLIAGQVFIILGQPGDWEKPFTVFGDTTTTFGVNSGAAIQLADGTVVLPVYYDEESEGGYSGANTKAGVIFSTDRGKTWGGLVFIAGGDEMQLMLNDDASIYAWLRNADRTGVEKRYTSTDGGLTWSAGVNTSDSLVGYSVCQPAIVRTTAGNLRRIYRLGGGYSSQSWHAYSVNEGVTWTDEALIPGLMAGFIPGYFQYGTLLPWGEDGAEGTAGIMHTETFNTKTIAVSDVSYFRLP